MGQQSWFGPGTTCFKVNALTTTMTLSPSLNSNPGEWISKSRGDLHLRLVVDTPVGLDDEQEALLRELAKLRSESVAEPRAGFVSKIRSAFS